MEDGDVEAVVKSSNGSGLFFAPRRKQKDYECSVFDNWIIPAVTQ